MDRKIWIWACCGVGLLMVLWIPGLAPNDPLEVKTEISFQKPSRDYPLGTDDMGRCVLSRMLTGTPISLGPAFAVVTTEISLGALIGTIAGYVGGWLERFLMGVVDAVLSFPSVLFVLGITGLLGPDIWYLIMALAVLSWPLMARVIRAQVRSLRQKEFVLAAKATGAGNVYIMRKHIASHLLTTIGSIASMDYAGYLIALSSYNFLGFGVQPPAPEWGAMLAEGRFYMDVAPLMVLAPGISIILVIFLALKISQWFSYSNRVQYPGI